MKLNTLVFMSLAAILTQACGSGGGQSSTAAALTEADIKQTLQNVNWVIQATTDAHGTCAYGARFTTDGHFGIAQLCDADSIDVFFEAISGSYKVANGRIDLKIDPDNCYGKNTALIEALGLKSGMNIQLSGNIFTVSGGSKTLNFDRDAKNKYFLHPMAASARGCNEKQKDGSFEWQLYSNPGLIGSFDAQFDTIIKNSTGGPETPETPETDEDEAEDPTGIPETVGGGVMGPTDSPTFGNTLRLSNASGRVSGTIALSSASAGGNLYIRKTSSADYLYVNVASTATASTGYTSVSASATVALSQSTINAFNEYCGAQPVAVEFYSNQLAPGAAGAPGSLPEAVKLWAPKPDGRWCYATL